MEVKELDKLLSAVDTQAAAERRVSEGRATLRRSLGDRYNQAVVAYGQTIGAFVNNVLSIAAPGAGSPEADVTTEAIESKLEDAFDAPARAEVVLARRRLAELGEGALVAVVEGWRYPDSTDVYHRDAAAWRDLQYVDAVTVSTVFRRPDQDDTPLGEQERYVRPTTWEAHLDAPDAPMAVEELEYEVKRQAELAVAETLPTLYEAMQDPSLNPNLAPYAGRLATESAI